ncbi:MAG: tRNA pseudouridine(38-40) synthase TruA [Actinobacteria bacterium]|nr:tRNA pseudouridine(38-40) synthase TruA [Actinomycetota bacterium]
MTEPTLFPESGFRRLRLDLAYDGTNFFGWAKQPELRTVQEEIEKALSTITRGAIDTVVAGRTDAGVHATGQVIHADVPDIFALEEIAYKLNRILDEDLRVLEVTTAPFGFHARFSALRRYYTYKILDSNKPILPLLRFDIAPWYRPLDIDAMNKSSEYLLGEHNFAAFCKYREGATTIRTLEHFSWERNSDGLLVADVIADAFCYSMVRNLVGAVACVGDGRFPPSWVKEVLENQVRISDSMVFPARGLTFKQVDYPSDDQLLARAEATIARRGDED